MPKLKSWEGEKVTLHRKSLKTSYLGININLTSDLIESLSFLHFWIWLLKIEKGGSFEKCIQFWRLFFGVPAIPDIVDSGSLIVLF